MAWKIIGLVEGRGGAVTALPEFAIGSPNNFEDPHTADRARELLNAAIPPREQKNIRYVVLPAIDDGLHLALKGAVAPPPQPSLAPSANWPPGPRPA
jgi:hypothetical protein